MTLPGIIRIEKLRSVLTIFFLVSAIPLFGQPSFYAPKHLHKVPDDTLIGRARKRIFPNSETLVVKDSLGKNIPKEIADNIDYTIYFADQYANDSGEVVEFVIRKITPADRGLLKKLIDAFQEGEKLALIDVNCGEMKAMLDTIYDIDQDNRAADREIDMKLDNENQIKVVSIIEKCGWPAQEKVGAKGMQAIFLVLQHASPRLRQKYFPFIKQSAASGDLSLAAVALMEDRMLMENGDKQKYGSQVVRQGDGPWKLHPVEDPENVNQRRAAMGLEPIEEYLKHFGIQYQPGK